MDNEAIQLDKGIRVEQELEPFPSCQLSRGVLFLDAVRSPAEQRFGAEGVELRDSLIVGGHRKLRVFVQGQRWGMGLQP